jgi:hypothetical protein
MHFESSGSPSGCDREDRKGADGRPEDASMPVAPERRAQYDVAV